MESFVICDTVTGARLLNVEPVSGDANRVLNTAQSGQSAFRIDARPASFTVAAWRELWRGLLTPWARTLVTCWNDVPVYARVITGRSYKDGVVTVRHTDVRDLALGSRYPFGVDSYWVPGTTPPESVPGKLTITNRSMPAAVALVTQAALTGPSGGAPYSLPVVLPSTSTAGTYSTVVENFNFRKAADVVAEIQEMDGGPDTEFSPRWSTTGTLEWVLRVGALTGPMIELWETATRSAVQSAGTDEDGSDQLTGVFGVGQGSGADMIVGGTPGAAVAAIPARDDTVRWKNVQDNAHASSLARESLRVNKYPKETQTLTVDRGMVDPTALVLGSTVRVHRTDHPWHPDRATDYRLLGHKSTVGSSAIDLTVGLVVT